MLTAPTLNPCSFSFTKTTTTHHHHHHHHHHLSISKRFNLLTVSANWERKKNKKYQHLFPHTDEEEVQVVVVREEEEEEEEEEGEIGGIGPVLMKSLNSNNPPRTIDAIQKNPKPTSHLSTRNSKEEEEEDKVELNGMDVLMALQRAKSQTRSKPKRRKQKGSLDMKVSGNGKDVDDDSIMDYRDVKPLNVKTDWGTRLDECEKSLQQLLLHQKF